MTHLGSRVSALVDGRLPTDEEERCWEHVLTCPPCRDLVEREGWVKTRLAGLSFSGVPAPSSLKDSLRGTPDGCSGAASLATRGWSRSMVAVGGSALGAAVIGAVALGPGLTTSASRPVQANVGGPFASTGTGTPSAAPKAAPRGAQRRDEHPTYLAALGIVPFVGGLDVSGVVEMVVTDGGYSTPQRRHGRHGTARTSRETMHQ